MTLEALTPMLRTWDLPATVAFYTQILCFTCDAFNQEWEWASLHWDGASIMLSGPNQHEGDSAPAFTGSLYFRVTDIDSLWLKFKDKTRVSYPIEDFEYGMREFAIYDNNGYLLQFGESR